MERSELKKIFELLITFTDHPLTLGEIADILDSDAPAEPEISNIIEEIIQDFYDRGAPAQISRAGGGYQLVSRPEYATWLKRLYKEHTTFKLSASSLETLSIVAYKQPITRAEIEEIRGVEVTAVLDSLVDKKLVKVVGRKETLGRPLLYGTTPEFMKFFGLNALNELPQVDAGKYEIEEKEEVKS